MNGWTAVTKSSPCEICGKTDNCKRSSDGNAIWCGRISGGSLRQNSGGQFLHVFDGQLPSDRLRSHPRTPAVINASPTSEFSPRYWERVAHAAFNAPRAESKRSELAKLLGVSPDSLARLNVGWSGRSRGWTIPERDAAGTIIGIMRRLPTGGKRRDKGSRAGLTYDPLRWMEPGTDVNDIFLVEGATDTSALMSEGLCAVGRPSNLGGVELLAELLQAVPIDRRIAVIGENDRKPHDSLPPATKAKHKSDCPHCSVCWPGWFGAKTTAERLAELLDRPVEWALTPDGRKDVRDWLNQVQKQVDFES